METEQMETKQVETFTNTKDLNEWLKEAIAEKVLDIRKERDLWYVIYLTNY